VSADDEGSVAVWYLRHDEPRAAVVADEPAALEFAVRLEELGHGRVLGVQFADGRSFDRLDWWALDEAWDRHRRELATRARGHPLPTHRTVRLPFGELEAKVPATAPDWLGRRQ
jgi:hypothetical protein